MQLKTYLSEVRAVFEGSSDELKQSRVGDYVDTASGRWVVDSIDEIACTLVARLAVEVPTMFKRRQ